MKVVLLQSTHKIRQETGRHIYCITDEFNMIVTLLINAYFLFSKKHSIVPAYLFLSSRSQYHASLTLFEQQITVSRQQLWGFAGGVSHPSDRVIVDESSTRLKQ